MVMFALFHVCGTVLLFLQNSERETLLRNSCSYLFRRFLIYNTLLKSHGVTIASKKFAAN